jgi:hypothetical protein
VVSGTPALADGATQAAAAAPHHAAPWDFNGDGDGDLAVGVPRETVGGKTSAGAVNVLLGGPSGVTTAGNRLIHQGTPSVVGSNERFDSFGTTVASGDFDADGYADLAVGANGEDAVDGSADAQGSITVLRGGPAGVTGVGSRRYLPAQVGATEVWGSAQAVGDLDADGYDDLVVASGSEVYAQQRGGATVLYGSPDGLDPQRAVHLTDELARGEDSPDPPLFGRAATVGDLTGDGIDDLVVTTQRGQSGGFVVYHGRRGQLNPRADEVYDQSDPSLEISGGVAYDTLGQAVTIGDFDGNGHQDLAISDYGMELPGFAGCAPGSCPGGVLLVSGADGGLDPGNRRAVSQTARGVPGGAHPADAFGWSLAAGDLDADGDDDLVVGAVAVDGTPSRYDSGAVYVFQGLPGGMQGFGAQRWTQHSPGVPGAIEPGDYLGREVRVVDLGRSATPDVVAQADGEDIGSVPDAGSATVLYSTAGTGLTSAGAQGWSQGTRGVAGAPEEDERFGSLEASYNGR